jgi:two-component system cell cycle sensor histidine kinase/response regulator CckA
VSGSACVAAGLWACVYPAIHRFPIVKPMEFFVDLSFVVAATTGVVLMHFEAARQRAEALASRYRSLFDSAQVGLFRVDRSGRVLAANPAMLALWNTSEEQALTLDLFRDVYVEPTIAQEVGERLLRGASVDAHEARWRRRDDDDVLVSVAARPVLGPDGVPLHYEGSAYDVGRERALRQQLEHSDRLDALGRLASGIAHDFNNALTVIINGTELARSHLQRDPRRANDLLDTTLEAARGATQLTRQLLTFSRRRTPEREAIDVHAVLRSLSRMLDATLGERVRVTLELAAEPVTAWAQPGQLEQILTNLALNSRDAMPEGGTLGFATRSVQLPDGREGTRIEVTDDGSGMSEATRRHLFEPFFTTKASELGTGLGLATVYGIVQQLEGRIEVTSEVGRGSTFAVELPAAATPERAAAPAATSLLPQARATVLVVEDRDLLRRSTELALRDAGHRVIVAASGHEALAIAQTQPFDVLLTDIVMPGMSGPILAEQLRLRWPQLPVVFMSGHLESAAEAPHLPGSRFLAKPFTVGELTATVAGAAHSAA